MQSLGKKPVVYLDQNWLSEITKAHLGSRTSIDKDYLIELSRVIQEGVSDDRFVCPSSEFHNEESERSISLYGDLKSTATALSRGLSFNLFSDIVHEQLLQQATKFVGLKWSAENWWRIPFNRNPDTPANLLPRLNDGVEVYVRFDLPVNEFRRMRDKVAAPIFQKYVEERKSFDLSYEDEVKHGMRLLMYENFNGVVDALSILGEQLIDLIPLHVETAQQQIERLEELGKLCNMGNGLQAFLSSEQFFAMPSFSIRAKLMAACVKYDSSHTPEPSLLDDFGIISTVLPYTDYLATDRYLAELIKKTKVGNDYGCQVFTMRQKDEFLNALCTL